MAKVSNMKYLDHIRNYGKNTTFKINYPIITMKTFNNICLTAESLVDDIPAAHNRKKKEAYHTEVIHLIDTLVKEIDEINVGDEIVYSVTENLGNKKYPYNIEVVEIATVKSVTEKSIMVSGHRLNPYNVKAIIRKEVK